MLSLFLRNLIFTILQPGIVAGLIPFLILGKDAEYILTTSWELHHYMGLFIFTAGLIIMLTCIAGFAVKGRGTLSPADPTQKLVISGLYRFSRNPMYLGVLLLLAGETLFFQSVYLLIYSLIVATSFNLFVIFREEPRLQKDFGDAYKEYCRKVRRWL